MFQSALSFSKVNQLRYGQYTLTLVLLLFSCDDEQNTSRDGELQSGEVSAGQSMSSGMTVEGGNNHSEDGGAGHENQGGSTLDQGISDPVCPEGETLLSGTCVPMVCEPSAGVCQEGQLFQCDPTGTSILSTAPDSCRGRTCIEGACRPIKHNVVILFDTSESMNSCATDERNDYLDCCGGVCPSPWPICETADQPLSRLGYSKAIFQEFFSDPRVQAAGRFALLTFPQTVIPFNNECSSSVYDYSNSITGDEGLHETPSEWFNQNRGEVVRVPFASTWNEDNIADMIQWVNFEEDLERDPELRATGLTPLGRSMFYAGEYFRHTVIAEGKPCQQDLDCQSPDYVCIEGACTDPVKDCRLNLLLVFTDGEESTARLIDEFYNPVVQARRMKFGLSCTTDQECLSGATCDSGYCRRPETLLDACQSDEECPADAFCEEGRCAIPGFLWPTDQGRCAQSNIPCIVQPFPEECSGFLEECLPIDPLYFDREQGANQLRSSNGDPISITTHVINVSDRTNESKLIASHGGGLHFQVDLNDSETLLRVLNRLVDYKRGGQCALEMQ